MIDLKAEVTDNNKQAAKREIFMQPSAHRCLSAFCCLLVQVDSALMGCPPENWCWLIALLS